jgi:hypothetical protein
LFRFPEAKIIGTAASEAKLNHINALTRKKYEVNCQDESQLSALNSVLEKEGAKLFYIAGDVATNAIVLVAHGIALGKPIIINCLKQRLLSCSRHSNFMNWKNGDQQSVKICRICLI